MNDPFQQKAKQTRLAQLLGISPQAVGQHIAAGTLPKGATYEESIRAYCERLRTAASGRVLPEALQEGRVKFMKARARSAELDLREREGELINTPETAAFVVDLVERLKQAVSHLAPLIAGAVQRHPYDLACSTIDAFFRATFDDALVRRELANCDAPLALAVEIARLRLPMRPTNTVDPGDPSYSGWKVQNDIADEAAQQLAELESKAARGKPS